MVPAMVVNRFERPPGSEAEFCSFVKDHAEYRITHLNTFPLMFCGS